MTRPILTLLLIALASSWVPPAATQGHAAPRTVAVAVPVAATSEPAASGLPTASGAVGGPKYSASATWCAPTPTQCQDWGGDARLAAVYGFRWGDRPYWVRLTRGDAFADALVVSHCACHGQDGYIDVSPAVFRRLAPLSRGRIDVEVELLNWPYEPDGDPPPHPDDDRLRVEDGGPQVTVPPTDTETQP